MRRAWFCYEATSTGPAPVIHYDSLPNAKNVLNPKILQVHGPLEKKWFILSEEIRGLDKITDYGNEVTSSFETLMQYYPFKEAAE